MTLAVSIAGCDIFEGLTPLDGEKVDCVCYNLPCFRVTLDLLSMYSARCVLGPAGATWIPLTSSDIGKVYCSDCKAYRREITLCVPDGTALPNPFVPSPGPFVGDAECKAFCATDSDLDPTAVKSSETPTWVSGGAGNATEIPLRGWFDERKLLYQGEVVTKNRYYGGEAFGECDAPDGGGAGTALSAGLATPSATVDVVGTLGPQSVVVDISPSESLVYVIAGASVSTASLHGTLAYESCGTLACPLSITSMQIAGDPFEIKDRHVSDLQVSTHGAIVSTAKGDGTYTVPAGARFDVSGVVGGAEKGLASGTKDSALVAVMGKRFGAAFAFEAADGGTMILVLIGDARNRPPIAAIALPPEVECAGPGGTVVSLDASGSVDPDGDTMGFLFTVNGAVVADGPGSAMSIQMPMGANHVTVTAYDGKGALSTAEASVLVQDTTPPVVSVATPDLCIWPPSHDMRLFEAGSLGVTVVDVCDPTPSVAVVSVSSDQAADEMGDGATAVDVVSGTGAFCVRSERTGTIEEGRTYEVKVVTTDESCNSAEQQVLVHVPHDLGATNCPAHGRLGGTVVPENSPACTSSAGEGTCSTASTSAAATTVLTAGGAQSCSSGGSAFSGPLVTVLLVALRRRRSP